jgi:hypothetical protein
MSKPGRNDACHCGSGKKYKKCCLEKDEAQDIVEQQYEDAPESEWLDDEKFEDECQDEDGEYFNDDDDPDLDYDDGDDDEEYPDDDDDIDEDEDFDEDEDEDENSKAFGDYPAISEAENKKVDDWWNKYKKLKSPTAIKEHLDEFLEHNSIDVIVNLGLEHEVLFELVTDYVKEGKADEIIAYMMQFREKYPEVYIRSAGYYDSDIIAYLIINNRIKEVQDYLNYFEAYPVNFVDKLFDTVEFLMATNKSEAAAPLAYKIYKHIWYSDEVFGGFEISDIPVCDIHSKYLKEHVSNDKLQALVDELKGLGLDFGGNYTNIEFWKERIEMYQRDLVKWDEKIPVKKSQLKDKIYRISENFTKYLHQYKQISFFSANYYASKLNDYYAELLGSDKKPKKLFNFPKNQIDQITTKISKDMMWLNVTKAFSLLNTIYYFAEYLCVCGNFSEEEKLEVQEYTVEFHNLVYTSHIQAQIETGAFEKFPLFG